MLHQHLTHQRTAPPCSGGRQHQHRRTQTTVPRSSSCTTTTGSNGRRRCRLRQARLADVPAINALMADVFGSGVFAGSGWEASPLLQQLEAAYAGAIQTDDRLAAALLGKTQAALACRTYRVGREAALLRGRLAVAQGQPAVFPTEGPTELRQLSKWRRARQFVCLVCEEVDDDDDDQDSSSSSSSSSNSSNSSNGDDSQRRLLGSVTVSLMQAEAALPPPFPSKAPLVAYLSNMAVAPHARRRGIGAALCAACGRVARAWRQPRVLLHVSADNAAGQALYSSLGFAAAAGGGGGGLQLPRLMGGGQVRMQADAAELAQHYFDRRLQRRGGAGAAGRASEVVPLL